MHTLGLAGAGRPGQARALHKQTYKTTHTANKQHLCLAISCSFIVLNMVAIFCPFGLFCEINISLLSLQTQPNTAPNLFQRGVEYGKYVKTISYLAGAGRPRQARALHEHIMYYLHTATQITHTYIYIYIYIHIYISISLSLSLSIYIYIYI